LFNLGLFDLINQMTPLTVIPLSSVQQCIHFSEKIISKYLVINTVYKLGIWYLHAVSSHASKSALHGI
jgi:hypothetical protein